jgi:hypothetical protein
MENLIRKIVELGGTVKTINLVMTITIPADVAREKLFQIATHIGIYNTFAANDEDPSALCFDLSSVFSQDDVIIIRGQMKPHQW